MFAVISRYRMPVLCALFLVVAVFIAHPIAEMGIDDDWSYIWSARVLAYRGHVVYNGWATALLGWQLYLGALFIKLFGFSFFTVRVSVFLVAIATTTLTQRLLVRLGISEPNATVGTLLLVLSPAFLSVAFTFMSDVPGLFAIVLCLYSCTRAIQASTTNRTILWLVFAALSNVGLGTVRQVAWLGVIVIVPTTALYLRQKPRVLMITIATWLVSVAAITWCMHWFSRQPYSLTDALIHIPHGHLVGIGRNIILSNTLALIFFALPLLIAFVLKQPKFGRQIWVWLAVLLLIGFILGQKVNLELALTSSTITRRGITFGSGILGAQPDITPYQIRMAITLVILGSVIGFGLFMLNAHKAPNWKGGAVFSWGSMFMLLAPFTVAYIALLVTRTNIFERYLLPLIFVFTACLLRLYEQYVGGRLPTLSVVLVLLFGALGVAQLHDLYARDRAILAITNEVISAGASRSQIRAGFEYDSWTQLENVGYVNDSRLVVPSGAYKLYPIQHGLSEACQSWFLDLMPSLNIRYALAYDQSTCYSPTSFDPVTFQAWLPISKRKIYVQRVP